MKGIIYFLLAILPLFLLSQNPNPDYNPIRTAVPFVNTPNDARGVGIGNTGSSTTADIYSMYWNPAKYAFIKADQEENIADYPKDLGFAFSYNPWYSDFLENCKNINFVAYKVLGKQTLATSFSLKNYGKGYPLTDMNGDEIGVFKPLEYSVDIAYSRKISNSFSLAGAFRYIHSDLASGSEVQGMNTKVGRSFAVDLALHYRKGLNLSHFENSLLLFGLNISNIGSKVSYRETSQDISHYNNNLFIPTNLRLGTSLLLEKRKHTFTFSFDINKLLVPTPPIYSTYFNDSIVKGMDPNVNVFKGMIQSFYDAPNGFKEEMQEIYFGVGFEYWYNKFIALRSGYYFEHKNKGNRENVNIGLGFRYKFTAIDIGYSIIPNKIRSEINNEIVHSHQQNNIYLNLVFQINTKGSSSATKN